MRYIFFMLLALAGCATANSGNYAAGLKEWVGQSELSLYEGWGTPDNTLYLTPVSSYSFNGDDCVSSRKR